MGLFRFHRSRQPKTWTKPLSAKAPGALLADETEEFLAGRLAQRIAESGRDVPPWAAVNRLAHGTRDQLHVLLLTSDGGWALRPSVSPPPWLPAERLLANRLLRRQPSAEELRHIQAEALVPLELRLIARSETESLSQDEVIRSAIRALQDYFLDR